MVVGDQLPRPKVGGGYYDGVGGLYTEDTFPLAIFLCGTVVPIVDRRKLQKRCFCRPLCL